MPDNSQTKQAMWDRDSGCSLFHAYRAISQVVKTGAQWRIQKFKKGAWVLVKATITQVVKAGAQWRIQEFEKGSGF